MNDKPLVDVQLVAFTKPGLCARCLHEIKVPWIKDPRSPNRALATKNPLHQYLLHVCDGCKTEKENAIKL